jgi:hypothetical protein
MKSLLHPVVVVLSLGLFACNETESLADDVKKVYCTDERIIRLEAPPGCSSAGVCRGS